MPQIRPFLFKVLLLTSLIILGGCSGSRIYEDTKGWGNEIWEGIKKGSQQAANSTKKALDSATSSSDEGTDDSKDGPSSQKTTAKVEPVESAPVKSETNGSTSTPAPLKASEKMAQPPGASVKGRYAVHLSSNKSKTSAEREWQELKNAFPKETQGLKLQVKPVKITGKGTLYRVLGASFENKALADTACARFKQKKQYCQPVKL